VRPEITTLPDGTTFSASAVISADRRYVRVTPMPMFSGIGEVTTFTFTGDQTGQGGTGGIGGGGGGFGGGGFGGGGFGGGGFGGGGFGGGGFSDQRLKDNIQPLEYGLETVKELNPVRYTWSESAEIHVPSGEGATKTKTIEPRKVLGDGEQVGLIAQEVEKLVPEITATDENGLKRMRYDLLVPVLIKAVQELSEENAELKSDIDQLRQRLEAGGM
jgi:hypothetical protein